MNKCTPVKNDKFRAFLEVERPGKEHAGSPFDCIGSDIHKVDATDKNGLLCILAREKFRFEKLGIEDLTTKGTKGHEGFEI